MTRTPLLAPILTMTAALLFTPLSSHAETVTIVKTGEIVTTTYKMPSAPVAGTTQTNVIISNDAALPMTEETTTEDVIRWRDAQPVSPDRVTPAAGVNERARRDFSTYND